MLEKIELFYDKLTYYLGKLLFVVMLVMTVNVFYDVVMRYVFSEGSIAMQEMEWHLFSVLILLGMSYSLMENAHVRVDILYDRWDARKKAMVNMIGAVIFILPISLLVAMNSVEFVMESFNSAEISGDPGGLTNRWIIKAFIPGSFWLLIFFAVGFFVKNLNVYRKNIKSPHEKSGVDV